MSSNITDKLTLEELWVMYKRHYLINKQAAIQKFLTHIGIINLFNEYPTEAEIRILIAKTRADSYKKIAQLLNLSVKTVETHLGNLKQKVKNFDLNSIIYSIKITDPHALDL
ncbi:MAG: Bacterial regulatory protein luxR family, partial [Burkholderiales bacterium]|nr:Bacterial regulatory protein luxR family [Burkholderiales bacterium]